MENNYYAKFAKIARYTPHGSIEYRIIVESPPPQPGAMLTALGQESIADAHRRAWAVSDKAVNAELQKLAKLI